MSINNINKIYSIRAHSLYPLALFSKFNALNITTKERNDGFLAIKESSKLIDMQKKK